MQNQVIIAGKSGQLLVYSGTPAFGNLIASISAVSATDLFGNLYLAGETNYTTVASGFLAVQIFAGTITWYHAATEAGPWTPIASMVANQAVSGVVTTTLTAGNTAHLLVTADANTYTMARLNLPVTPNNQLINTTNAATLNNCTANLDTGVTYRFEAEIQYTANASAGAPSFQFASSASTSLFWANGFIWQTNGAGAGTNRFAVSTSGALFQGPAMVSAAQYIARIKGELVTTSTGAISLQAFTSIAADTFTVNNGYMELSPLA